MDPVNKNPKKKKIEIWIFLYAKSNFVLEKKLLVKKNIERVIDKNYHFLDIFADIP